MRGSDAGLAPIVSPHSRSRGDIPSRPPDRFALDRRADASHDLCAGADARAKVAQRLERDGIRLGDRVATLAWNTWRHFEAWYGIMGIGAIYHTVNPRLFPDQIAWIVNHAQDRVMMTDLTFVPLLEKLADRLPSIERYIVLTDARICRNIAEECGAV